MLATLLLSSGIPMLLGGDEIGRTQQGDKSAMTDADWDDSSALAVAIYLDGSDSPDRAAEGYLLVDDDFLIVVNAWWQPLTFTIPVTRTLPNGGQRDWHRELGTYAGTTGPAGAAVLHVGDQFTASPRSITVLRANTRYGR
jgi:isoamylase